MCSDGYLHFGRFEGEPTARDYGLAYVFTGRAACGTGYLQNSDYLACSIFLATSVILAAFFCHSSVSGKSFSPGTGK